MSEFRDLSLFEDYVIVDVDNDIEIIQKTKIEPVIIERKEKLASKELIVFSKEELEGYRLEKLPENISGMFYIVSGIVKDTEIHKHDADIIIQNGTESLKVGAREKDNFFRKISDLKPGDRVTAVMCSNCCIDLKIGPYFGCCSWMFVNETNPNAAKKIIVKNSRLKS